MLNLSTKDMEISIGPINDGNPNCISVRYEFVSLQHCASSVERQNGADRSAAAEARRHGDRLANYGSIRNRNDARLSTARVRSVQSPWLFVNERCVFRTIVFKSNHRVGLNFRCRANEKTLAYEAYLLLQMHYTREAESNQQRVKMFILPTSERAALAPLETRKKFEL